jgi:hypothetical protein
VSSLNPPPVSPATFGKKDDAAATTDGGTFSFLALFKRALASLTGIKNSLDSIGSSTTPVPVTSNLKSGNYSYAQFGAPSISTLAADQAQRSTSFTLNGESITVLGSYFQTGGIVVGPGAYIWLECDPAGGTNYRPVMGTKRTIATDSPISSGGAYPSFVVTYDKVRGGNWRVVVNFGAPTGTATGSSGFNVFVLN